MTADHTTLPVLAVLFLATLIRSAFGFGEALVAVPLLALLIPVEVAAPVAVLVSVTVAGLVLIQDWRHVHPGSAGRLILSTMFGIPFGLLLLTTVAEPVVKAVLAAVIIAFSAYSPGRAQPVRVGGRPPGVAVRVRGGGARGGLRHERAAAGGLRGAAAVVALSGSGRPCKGTSCPPAWSAWPATGRPASGSRP